MSLKEFFIVEKFPAKIGQVRKKQLFFQFFYQKLGNKATLSNRREFNFDFFFLSFRRFRGNSSKQIDFAHRSGALARPGSRELRAVKIPASYDAWRPPKRRKNDSEKIQFFWSRKLVFHYFSWILEEINNVRRLPSEVQLQIDLF